MSLTPDDLRAIKKIVDDAVDQSKEQTAAGFQELHQKFQELHQKIEEAKTDQHAMEARLAKRIDDAHNEVSFKDGKLQNTVERVDDHEVRLGALEQAAA